MEAENFTHKVIKFVEFFEEQHKVWPLLIHLLHNAEGSRAEIEKMLKDERVMDYSLAEKMLKLIWKSDLDLENMKSLLQTNTARINNDDSVQDFSMPFPENTGQEPDSEQPGRSDGKDPISYTPLMDPNFRRVTDIEMEKYVSNDEQTFKNCKSRQERCTIAPPLGIKTDVTPVVNARSRNRGNRPVRWTVTPPRETEAAVHLSVHGRSRMRRSRPARCAISPQRESNTDVVSTIYSRSRMRSNRPVRWIVTSPDYTETNVLPSAYGRSTIRASRPARCAITPLREDKTACLVYLWDCRLSTSPPKSNIHPKSSKVPELKAAGKRPKKFERPFIKQGHYWETQKIVRPALAHLPRSDPLVKIHLNLKETPPPSPN